MGEKILDEHLEVAKARASVIERPDEKRNRQLGFVEHEGQLVHKSELERRATQNEESEEDFWNDMEGE